MLTFSGCGVYDSYRRPQIVSFRAKFLDSENISATYEFKERVEELEVSEEDGIFKMEIPGIRSAGMTILIFPIGSDSSKEEKLRFRNERKEEHILTVKEFLDPNSNLIEIINKS